MPGTVGQVERREGGQDRIMTNRNVTIVSGGEVVMADTTNLGPGGMFVATNESFGIGDRFICRIDLGEPYKPVLSGAEVRWISGHDGQRGLGVMFLDIAEAAESLGGELPAQGPETVRVRLEGVGSAIDADVIERNGQEIVVDFKLPFLRSGTHVEVGPDVAARTAGITRVEMLPGADDGGLKVRLTMDIEPSPVKVAAGQIVNDAARSSGREEGATRSSSPRVWQLPAALPETAKKSSPPARASSPIPTEFVVEAAEAIEEEVLETEAAASGSEPPILETKSSDTATEATAEAEFYEDTLENDVKTSASSEAFSNVEDEEEALEGKAAEADEADEVDEVDTTSFNPVRGALERIIGAAMVARLAALWTRGVEVIKERLNGPKLIAVARRGRDLAGRGWTAARKRLGPALGKTWKTIRTSALLRRRRRQTRGEPSKVVRNLTERARKVAAGRGKTVAIAIFVFTGLAVLGTDGYGLWGSANAEQELEQLQSEAASAGWSSAQWDEPEPADSPDPS